MIGNPPYQEEAKGDSGRAEPIYHQFMEAAYGVAEKVVLITPARFLFNAGQTPKHWNRKMLDDEHLRVAYYESDGRKVFPGADIKGGIAVTYRDSRKPGDPIGTFLPSETLASIVKKVESGKQSSLEGIIESKSAYNWTGLMHSENPEAADLMSDNALTILSPKVFTQLDFLFAKNKPTNVPNTRKVLGLVEGKRTIRWVKSDYISGPGNMSSFKVAVPGANGSGVFGEALSKPVVLEPEMAATQTFITIGSFDEKHEAEACQKYIKTKFARSLLGVLKVTQNNARGTWKHVPLQDFTNASDINWSKSISEIDQQLYAKYRLSDDEIEFIETNVKPMD